METTHIFDPNEPIIPRSNLTNSDSIHFSSTLSVYYLPDAKENFKEANVKYTPLLSYPELLKKENESGHITSDQYDILKTWHEDPWAWGKKFNS